VEGQQLAVRVRVTGGVGLLEVLLRELAIGHEKRFPSGGGFKRSRRSTCSHERRRAFQKRDRFGVSQAAPASPPSEFASPASKPRAGADTAEPSPVDATWRTDG
jgi:hypothetical protein